MPKEVVGLLAPLPEGILLDATVGDGGHLAALVKARHEGIFLGMDRDAVAIDRTKERLVLELGLSEDDVMLFDPGHPSISTARSTQGTKVFLANQSFDCLQETSDVLLDQLGSSEDATEGISEDATEGISEDAAKGRPPTERRPRRERALSVIGVLFDLGVRSQHFDEPERGFSFKQPGPLDMRMDQRQELTAWEVVNTWSINELQALFARHGEGALSRRIAKAIVAARPIDDTLSLAEVVVASIPAALRRSGPHPARRVFQAIRDAVNQELDLVRMGIEAAVEALSPGGRLVVIDYHSGEDRIVKHVMEKAVTGGCTCPPSLPCGCGAVRKARWVVKKALRPSVDEVNANPRAQSARLRAIERLEQ
jgi:16S rRNA (cytosine1402-N4)-methyltransferase